MPSRGHCLSLSFLEQKNSHYIMMLEGRVWGLENCKEWRVGLLFVYPMAGMGQSGYSSPHPFQSPPVQRA